MLRCVRCDLFFFFFVLLIHVSKGHESVADFANKTRYRPVVPDATVGLVI